MVGLIDSILQKYESVWALNHALSLMNWDLETYMPEDGAARRGEATASVELLKRNIILSMREEVERAAKQEGLDDINKGMIRVLKRQLDFYTKIPSETIEKLYRITSTASVVWRKARATNDFKSFSPLLKTIVEINREIAEKMGYTKHPYNALLDINEEGLTTEDLDSILSQIVPVIKDVVSKTHMPSKHELEKVRYKEEDMRRVNESLIDILQMPRKKFRMDVSAHPFTVGMSVSDVRITTRYEGIDFRSTMFSVIHEAGHAIYELQLPSELEKTPVGVAVSGGIHESQSRFWENVIGRSREFVEIVYPILTKYLDFVKKYDHEEIYRYFNIVRPSTIRVDADEVTYNLHIAVRYEIEKRLIDGSISVDEAPELWNELMEKYVGVRPSSDSDGILQDIHWSGGAFGSFPNYLIGNVVAGMIYSKIGKLRRYITEQDFSSVKGFLKDKIHQYGSIYPPKELLKRSFGESYNAEHLAMYLREKYLSY
ncbi:carboxypeptidase M32 [Sulfolobales archaeon HS-7]|nr:carboxypeptidase M32 [Sulfolobales archaeon HS-7]